MTWTFRKGGLPMSAKYFVIDNQGTGWKENVLWDSVKQIADSIRDESDCDLSIWGGVSDFQVIKAWDLEYHRLTPSNCMKFGVSPSDFREDYL